MKFLNALLIALVGVLMFAGFTTSAFARNETVNGYFIKGHKIAPKEGITGVANFQMTRPDNGEVMYFEECQHESKGWLCKYEVLFDENASGNMSSTGTGDSQGNAKWPDQDHQWNGVFDSFRKVGNKYEATVKVNGHNQTAPYTFCIDKNGKWCY